MSAAPSPGSSITHSTADAGLLAPGGPLARLMGGSFEIRPQQAAMIDAAAKAMASRARLLVEAGTGVGKSFAYLIPAIRRIIEHHEVVVVEW